MHSMATTVETTTQTPATPDPNLSVVIPVHNEPGLGDLLDEVVAVCDEYIGAYEVVVVDDGSTDGTTATVAQAAECTPDLEAVILQDNFGQSAALSAGIDRAVGDVVVPMDGDGQNDPADIPVLVDRLEAGDADVVSGWRRDRDDPLSKRIPSRIQTRLAIWTGPDIHDFGCTLTAYSREAIAEADLRGERHRYLPAQLDQLGYEVDEVEVNHRARDSGESHYGTGRLVRGFVDLLYHLFRVRYRSRPMHLFGAVGLVVTGLGLGLGGWLTVQRLVLGAGLLPRLPALLLAVSMTLWGTGILALGIVTELLTEVLAQRERPYRVDRVVGGD